MGRYVPDVFRMRIKLQKKNRKCKQCDKLLSRYNPNKYCWACKEMLDLTEMGLEEVR